MNVKKAKLRKKSKRLATTLVLFSIATLLILNLVSAVCIGTLTSSGMNQKQDAFLQQTTLSGKRQVEQFIEQYIGITETLAQSTQLQHAVTGTAQDRPISGTPEFSEARYFCIVPWRNTRISWELALAVSRRIIFIIRREHG